MSLKVFPHGEDFLYSPSPPLTCLLLASFDLLLLCLEFPHDQHHQRQEIDFVKVFLCVLCDLCGKVFDFAFWLRLVALCCKDFWFISVNQLNQRHQW
jgi:hypothetical protein